MRRIRVRRCGGQRKGLTDVCSDECADIPVALKEYVETVQEGDDGEPEELVGQLNISFGWTFRT